MSDWDTRSAGAVFANRLDSQSARDTYVLLDSKQSQVTFDPLRRPLGANGSIKIDVLNGDGANNGNLDIPWGTSFSDGDTFYVSWRVRAPASFVYQPWPISGGGDSGGKLGIISHNTGSNQPFEVVAQTTHMRNTFQGYHQDGSSFPPFDESASTECSGSDFRQQPEIDNGLDPLVGNDPDDGVSFLHPDKDCHQDRARFGSLYSGQSEDDYYIGYGDPIDGGMRFKPDTWYTITFRVAVGNLGSPNSAIRMRIAEENKGYTTIVDATGVTLGDNGLPFNALHLLPYVTNRVSGGRKITTQPVNIGGVPLHVCGLGTPVGNGTLEYNANTRRFRWHGNGESFGTARGFSEVDGKMILNVAAASGQSYVVLEVVDPLALPLSGVVTDTITIADGRPDTYINFADVIVSESDIPAPQPSALELAAAALPVGAWVQMSPSNQNSVLGNGPASGSTISYCNTMPWNPINKSIEIIGMDHNGGSVRHMRYSEAENGFVLVAADAGLGSETQHGYDHNSVNPTTGDIYHRKYSGFSGEIEVYKKPLTGSFASIGSVEVDLDQVAIGTCWWTGPFTASGGHGAQGSHMMFNSGDADGSATDGTVVAYDPIADSWFFNQQSMAPNYGSGSTYHSVMEYSAVHNCAVYGGGNAAPQKLWRMDADASVTAMPNVPSGKEVGILQGVLTVDPVSGNFLLISNGELWELNPTGSGAWTQQTGDRDPPAAVDNPDVGEYVIATPIPEYGVIAVIAQPSLTGGTMWLYKHAEANFPLTVLAQAAAALPAGQWAQLPAAANQSTAMTQSGNWLTSQSNDIGWDPIRRHAHFVGKAQGTNPYRHIYYRESEHDWVVGVNVTGNASGHGYDHQAVDPFSGNIYFREYGQDEDRTIYRANPSDLATWTPIADWPLGGYVQVALGMCFWSGSFSGAAAGALLVYNSGENSGEIQVYDILAGAWDTRISGFGGTSTYHSAMVYSPVHNVAILGGGNDNPREVWRLNSDRSVTQLDDAPRDFGVQVPSSPGDNGYLTVDPVTGHILLLSTDGTFWELDPTASTGNQWAQLTGNRAPPSNVYSNARGTINWPVPEYGVTVWAGVSGSGTSPTMYIYKHAGAAPAEPTGSAAPTDGPDTMSASGTVSGALGVQRTLSFLET